MELTLNLGYLFDFEGVFILKTAVQPKETKEAKEFEGLYANAATHLPGEWRLPQNLFSFGILSFFRPSNCRIKIYDFGHGETLIK